MFNINQIPEAPADLHYGLRAEFQSDSHIDKVNLVIGAYKDDNGQPWMLPVVKKAMQIYHEDPLRNNEYLPISGEAAFCKAAFKVLFGSDPSEQKSKICSFQTISGTGAVHLGATFLSKFSSDSKLRVYLSKPTWDNHVPLFTHAGFQIEHYPYYNPQTKGIDFDAMIQTMQSAPRGSVVVLQVCAHNPTGLDPTQEQWNRIAEVVQAGELFPFFDCAYQGFATGDLERDSYAVRHFAKLGLSMFVAQSFSKNLGLYGQRTGCLHFVAGIGDDESAVMRVASQLAVLQRCEISTPPIYGAKIALTVLNDETLSSEWVDDLATMSGRIAAMRAELRTLLEEDEVSGDWSHITSQIGMFAYTGLSEEQVELMKSRWHVYMLPSGRMSVSGLNAPNVAYVAKAIKDVVANV